MWVVAGRQWIEGGVGVQQECIPKAMTEYLTLTSPWTRLVFLMDLIVKQCLCVGILKQNLLDAVQLLHRFVLQLTKTCDYRAQVWKHRNSPLMHWVQHTCGFWFVLKCLCGSDVCDHSCVFGSRSAGNESLEVSLTVGGDASIFLPYYFLLEPSDDITNQTS